MFNAEPIEPWTEEERLEFEEDVRQELQRTIRSAAWAGLALLLACLCIVPFLAGHAWNRYWIWARYLLYVALAIFLNFGMKVGFVYSSWQSARETRREYER